MKIVKLTEEQINVTIQLLDIAVKSAGLNAAEAAVVIAKALKDAEDAPSEVDM